MNEDKGNGEETCIEKEKKESHRVTENGEEKEKDGDKTGIEIEDKENGIQVSKPATERTNKYACACAIIATMISVLLGYDTGVMSGAMIFIKEDLKINDTQVEVLAGIINLCALVGSLGAGRTSDWIGRRFTIVFASIIFVIGAVLMGIGSTYAVLMTGRCIAGIGIGYALMIAPTYSAEISSPSSRGFLTSLTEVFISVGILFGYVSNNVFAKLPLKIGWRLMLGIAAIPSIALAFGILLMPESPRWLVMQGRLGDAKTVLDKVSNTKEESELRLRDIKNAAGIDVSCTDDIVKLPRGKKTHGEGVWKDLFLHPTVPVRRMLIAAIGINFFEHATGIEAVVLYSPRIFKKAGVRSKHKLLLATVAVGFTKTCFILVATFLLDKVGRRPLLLTSTGGMFVSLSVLGFGLTMVDHTKRQLIWAISLCIASVLSFVAFFSIGMGPITWVYCSEIFPLRLRAQGVSIAVAVNRVMNGTISISFLSLYKAISIGGSFFLFAGMSFLAWLFFYFFLPETKGRSLEEMEEVFRRRGHFLNTAGDETESEKVGNVESGNKSGSSG